MLSNDRSCTWSSTARMDIIVMPSVGHSHAATRVLHNVLVWLSLNTGGTQMAVDASAALF